MVSPRAWREELGKTREEMGLFIGLKPHAARYGWRNYETGVRVPSIDIMARCEELSEGRVTARSWLAVTMALPKLPPGRLYGTRRSGPSRRQAHPCRP